VVIRIAVTADGRKNLPQAPFDPRIGGRPAQAGHAVGVHPEIRGRPVCAAGGAHDREPFGKVDHPVSHRAVLDHAPPPLLPRPLPRIETGDPPAQFAEAELGNVHHRCLDRGLLELHAQDSTMT
jgi:hypothetical protein